MTEQKNNEIVSNNVVKVEHSREYNCCKHSYESLITTTKAFVFNFNNLTQEEKILFKSLQTYIKQLQKCIDTLKPQQRQKTVKNIEEVKEIKEIKETIDTTETIIKSKSKPKSKPKKSIPNTQKTEE